MSDWIEWKGGECPVPCDTLVNVVFRGGLTDDEARQSCIWEWKHTGRGSDIMAYRVVSEPTYCPKCQGLHYPENVHCDGLRTKPLTDIAARDMEVNSWVDAALSPAPLTGGKLSGDHYYRVQVAEPISPEVQPYTAECADIIEALGMTFNEGEAFKALWRLAASRQGRGKPGNKAQYDADKVAHYGVRVAAQTKRGAL